MLLTNPVAFSLSVFLILILTAHACVCLRGPARPVSAQASGHQGDLQRICAHEAGGGTVSRTTPPFPSLLHASVFDMGQSHPPPATRPVTLFHVNYLFTSAFFLILLLYIFSVTHFSSPLLFIKMIEVMCFLAKSSNIFLFGAHKSNACDSDWQESLPPPTEQSSCESCD